MMGFFHILFSNVKIWPLNIMTTTIKMESNFPKNIDRECERKRERQREKKNNRYPNGPYYDLSWAVFRNTWSNAIEKEKEKNSFITSICQITFICEICGKKLRFLPVFILHFFHSFCSKMKKIWHASCMQSSIYVRCSL